MPLFTGQGVCLCPGYNTLGMKHLKVRSLELLPFLVLRAWAITESWATPNGCDFSSLSQKLSSALERLLTETVLQFHALGFDRTFLRSHDLWQPLCVITPASQSERKVPQCLRSAERKFAACRLRASHRCEIKSAESRRGQQHGGFLQVLRESRSAYRPCESASTSDARFRFSWCFACS